MTEKRRSKKGDGMTTALDVRMPRTLFDRITGVGATLGKTRSAIAREAMTIGIPQLEEEAAIVERHRRERLRGDQT